MDPADAAKMHADFEARRFLKYIEDRPKPVQIEQTHGWWAPDDSVAFQVTDTELLTHIAKESPVNENDLAELERLYQIP